MLRDEQGHCVLNYYTVLKGLSLVKWKLCLVDYECNCVCLFQDVFVYDTKDEVFVWVGGDASTTEKANGMNYAHVRIHTTNLLSTAYEPTNRVPQII